MPLPNTGHGSVYQDPASVKKKRLLKFLAGFLVVMMFLVPNESPDDYYDGKGELIEGSNANTNTNTNINDMNAGDDYALDSVTAAPTPKKHIFPIDKIFDDDAKDDDDKPSKGYDEDEDADDEDDKPNEEETEEEEEEL